MLEYTHTHTHSHTLLRIISFSTENIQHTFAYMCSIHTDICVDAQRAFALYTFMRAPFSCALTLGVCVWVCACVGGYLFALVHSLQLCAQQSCSAFGIRVCVRVKCSRVFYMYNMIREGWWWWWWWICVEFVRAWCFSCVFDGEKLLRDQLRISFDHRATLGIIGPQTICGASQQNRRKKYHSYTTFLLSLCGACEP